MWLFPIPQGNIEQFVPFGSKDLSLGTSWTSPARYTVVSPQRFPWPSVIKEYIRSQHRGYLLWLKTYSVEVLLKLRVSNQGLSTKITRTPGFHSTRVIVQLGEVPGTHAAIFFGRLVYGASSWSHVPKMAIIYLKHKYLKIIAVVISAQIWLSFTSNISTSKP